MPFPPAPAPRPAAVETRVGHGLQAPWQRRLSDSLKVQPPLGCLLPSTSRLSLTVWCLASLEHRKLSRFCFTGSVDLRGSLSTSPFTEAVKLENKNMNAPNVNSYPSSLAFRPPRHRGITVGGEEAPHSDWP